MKYKIQQKLLSSAEDFTIKNENDEDIFYVREKSLPKGLYLCLEDTEGNVLYYFEQQISGFFPNIIYMTLQTRRFLQLKRNFHFLFPNIK